MFHTQIAFIYSNSILSKFSLRNLNMKLYGKFSLYAYFDNFLFRLLHYKLWIELCWGYKHSRATVHPPVVALSNWHTREHTFSNLRLYFNTPNSLVTYLYSCISQVPQDRTIMRHDLRTVSLPLFVCMSTISCCGILVAIALIIFNICNRHRR